MTQEIREKALHLAVGFHSGNSTAASTVVTTAQQFAEFLHGEVRAPESQQPAPDAADPKPSTRGRKAKGEGGGVAVSPPANATTANTSTPAVPSSSTSAPDEADPFVDATPPAPVATQAEMRAAVLALRDATDQGTALAILKVYGYDTFGSIQEKDYGNIARDAKAKTPVKAAVEADPFADATPATVVAASTAKSETKLTLDDVKKAVVAAQKRTGTDIVQRVVMDHGGSAPGANGV